jgi:hypothetical protein
MRLNTVIHKYRSLCCRGPTLGIEQLLCGIKNFAALPATDPTIRNAKLVGHNPVRSLACGATGDQVHEV